MLSRLICYPGVSRACYKGSRSPLQCAKGPRSLTCTSTATHRAPPEQLCLELQHPGTQQTSADLLDQPESFLAIAPLHMKATLACECICKRTANGEISSHSHQCCRADRRRTEKQMSTFIHLSIPESLKAHQQNHIQEKIIVWRRDKKMPPATVISGSCGMCSSITGSRGKTGEKGQVDSTLLKFKGRWTDPFHIHTSMWMPFELHTLLPAGEHLLQPAAHHRGKRRTLQQALLA